MPQQQDDKLEQIMGFGGFGKTTKKPGGKKAAPLTGGGFADMLMKSMVKDKGGKKKRDDAIRAREMAHSDRKVTEDSTSPVMRTDVGDIAKYPITHRVELNSHVKCVLSLDVDPTGTRLITGSMDYNVKIWHFATMDSGFRPTKTHEPHEGYPVNDLSWAPSGTRYVASISHRRPIIFSQEGKELKEFVNGDVYLHQESKTRGHTARTNTVKWAKDDENLLISAGCDGTVRLWNPERVDARQEVVFVHGEKNGKKKPEVNHADLNGTNKAIITTGNDGRVAFWARNKNFSRPDLVINAHPAIDGGCTSVATTADGRYLTTRGMEGSVKLFDTRKPTEPVAVKMGLETFFETTNIIYGGAEKVIVTGTGADPRHGEKGRVVLLSSTDLTPVADIPIGVGSISKVVWPSILNQIFVGCQDGSCHVLYNPTTSMKGVVLGAVKQKSHVYADSVPTGMILNPNTDEELEKIMEKMHRYGHENYGKRFDNTTGRKLPGKGKKPDENVDGPRITKQAAFLQEFAPDLVKRKHMKGEDPRAALLAVQDQAKAGTLVDGAYKSQPKIFAEPEQEEGEKKGKKREFSQI